MTNLKKEIDKIQFKHNRKAIKLSNNIMDNILEPRLIGVLTHPKNNYQFFIPSYQRGYRWSKEEVTALLEDLLEFSNYFKNKETYCLQPIVIKQLKDGRYEVLDGQQRLTTLYILLSYLKQEYREISLFSLEYATRKDSESFLKNLNNKVNYDNPDYFYISEAFDTISQWFEVKSLDYFTLKMDFVRMIMNHLEIIWYEIKDESNPIDIFTRINIGKIPLTNSELVKAIFLSKNNLQLGLSNDEINNSETTKQIEEVILNNKQAIIALEWDLVEKRLQDDKFWAFIFNQDHNNYQTRIDFILDLITGSTINQKDNLESFNKYYNQIKEVRNNKEALDELKKTNNSFIEDKWLELKSYFDILLEWYENKWYNHIIGYLISRRVNILDLLNSYKNKNRGGFKEELVEKVKKYILVKNIAELSYGTAKENKLIENILVFHNVIGSLIQPDTSVHFPFEKMNRLKWSLEHIYAQNSDDLLEKDYPLWVTDHLIYFRRINDGREAQVQKIIANLEELENRYLKNPKEVDKTSFNQVFSDVEEYVKENTSIDMNSLEDSLKEYKWVTNEHSIANLTLLDIGANSYLSNSLFAIKREKIKKLDKDAAFIPNETRKVFLKYYSNAGGHDAYWTFEDRIAYVKDIESKINELNNLLIKE